MSPKSSILAAAVCGVLALPAVVSAQVAGAAPDQQQLLDRLIRDLQCQPGQKCDPQTSRTRSLSGAVQRPANPATDQGRRTLEQDAKTRSLPSTDVEVYFPYNSAELLPETRRTLDTMAQALRARQLSASSFAVVGHTDARGGDSFNQALSERRAAAVRDYLASRGGVELERLSAWGRGRTEPKEPNDPLAGVNRRVQLINTGTTAAAAPAAPASKATSSAPSRPPADPPAAAKEECRQYSPVANATVECQRN